MQTLEQIDAAIKRWNTKLTIAHNRLRKLYKQKARAQKKPVHALGLTFSPPPAENVPPKKPDASIEAIDASSQPPFDADEAFSIPTELRITTDVEQMRADRRAREAAERKKMPLTGRAALAAVSSKTSKRKAASGS